MSISRLYMKLLYTMYFIDKKEFAEMEIGRWAGG